VRGALTTTVNLLLASCSLAQEAPQAPKKPESPTFFSGTVVANTATEITVHRRALISNATTKTFAIDGDTKIEGKLKVKVNVTVRYVTEEEGRTRAVHIIVR
jgi:hypothetical protein